MLTQLNIHNFVLVENLEISFDSGMTVLTGESGAGKSILLGALDLVLGARSTKRVIRAGTERCEVSAEFSIEGNEIAQSYLAQLDLLDAIAPQRCLVRRVVRGDGRSQAYINTSPVNLSVLAEFCSPLIEIHGQHQHQRLLDRRTQLAWLDDYGANNTIRETVSNAFSLWRTAKAELETLQLNTQTITERSDLLQYQIGELKSLGLSEGEVEQLDASYKRLVQAKDIRLRISKIDESIRDCLLPDTGQWNRDLHEIDDDHKALVTARELLNSSEIQLLEAQNELRVYLETLEIDEQGLADLEQRLMAIHDVSRKHRVKANELETRQKELEVELGALSVNQQRLNTLSQEVVDHEKMFRKRASILSSARRKHAVPFQRDVCGTLDTLSLPGVRLTLDFVDAESDAGLETVEYLVATNHPNPPGRLRDIASGGELARISLAIQVVAAQRSQLPCLILDEADIGVGGTTADVVGRMLQKLASHTQVVCVTHAPQVAALANAHMKVEKSKHQDTSIEMLSDAGRVDELARMLGGRKITDETKDFARTLLADARN